MAQVYTQDRDMWKKIKYPILPLINGYKICGVKVDKDLHTRLTPFHSQPLTSVKVNKTLTQLCH